jgi:hypothetical protein
MIIPISIFRRKVPRIYHNGEVNVKDLGYIVSLITVFIGGIHSGNNTIKPDLGSQHTAGCGN